MFRVAAHPLCAVTPAARLALREPGLSPKDHPPRVGVQRAMRPSGEGLGRGAPASPLHPRVFSMTEGNQLNREPGVGTAHYRVKSRFFKGTKARRSVR